MNTLRLLVLLISIVLSVKTVYCQAGSMQTNTETNVVFGAKHIFTVETPIGWINDKQLAQQFGLVCFFYPLTDSAGSFRNYMYALGIDKRSPDEKLKDFIKHDLVKFEKNYPEYKFDTTEIENIDSIINAKKYSFYNLADRYKEEVLYYETDSSFIIMSFTTQEESGYNEYLPVFERFIDSFVFKGSNPKSFLEQIEAKQPE